jgi:LmbE family N-acetylglucosaminyl deacetylase
MRSGVRSPPVRAFDPDPSLVWLFCPTHPDDELAFAAWARHLVRNGNEVWLSWTHHTPVRRAEALRAAAALGVPEARAFFHGGTDGSVCDEIPTLLPSFRAMMERVRPDRVVCGAFEQGHLDHDATHRLVTLAYDGVVLEAPFYHTYVRPRLQTMNRFSDPRGQEIRELDAEERAWKKGLARNYPSQTIWRILFWHEATRWIVGRRPELLRDERLRVVRRPVDYLRPAHPSALAARVEASPRWRRWREAMARL